MKDGLPNGLSVKWSSFQKRFEEWYRARAVEADKKSKENAKLRNNLEKISAELFSFQDHYAKIMTELSDYCDFTGKSCLIHQHFLLSICCDFWACLQICGQAESLSFPWLILIGFHWHKHLYRQQRDSPTQGGWPDRYPPKLRWAIFRWRQYVGTWTGSRVGWGRFTPT